MAQRHLGAGPNFLIKGGKMTVNEIRSNIIYNENLIEMFYAEKNNRSSDK